MDTKGGGSNPAPPPTILAGRVSGVFSVFGCEGGGTIIGTACSSAGGGVMPICGAPTCG